MLSKHFTYLSIILLEVLFEELCTAKTVSKTVFCPEK